MAENLTNWGLSPFDVVPRYPVFTGQSYNLSINAPGRDYSLLGEGHFCKGTQGGTMKALKQRISALEKRVGFESIEVDPQHTYLERERLRLMSALTEAIGTGTDSDVQEVRKKLAENAEALKPYGPYPYRPCSFESYVEALERAAMMKDDSR